MKTTPPEEEGQEGLPSELGFALAPRETDPAPAVTNSGRPEPTTAMVTRSRAREGRSSVAISEIVTEQEPEIAYPTETQVFRQITSETGSGVARLYPTDTVSPYIAQDRPVIATAVTVSQETNPFLTKLSEPAPSRKILPLVNGLFSIKVV